MSVVDALSRAFETTRRLCFQPFAPARWVPFGLVAFLATCGESGSSSSFSLPGGGGDGEGGSPEAAGEALRWMGEHVGLVVGIAAAGVVVVLALIVFVTWVSSHGKMVFVDGIARGEVRFREAWSLYSAEAHSLFLLRLGFSLIAGFVVLAIAGAAAVPVLRFVAAGATAEHAGGLLILVPAFGALATVLVLVWAVLLAVDELLVPTMVVHRLRVRGAWHRLREAMTSRLGDVAVYLVVRAAVGAVAGGLLVALGFLTCCVGFLPVVSHVLFLPVYLFLRSISLHYVAQIGPGWSVFDALAPIAADEPPPTTP